MAKKDSDEEEKGPNSQDATRANDPEDQEPPKAPTAGSVKPPDPDDVEGLQKALADDPTAAPPTLDTNAPRIGSPHVARETQLPTEGPGSGAPVP